MGEVVSGVYALIHSTDIGKCVFWKQSVLTGAYTVADFLTYNNYKVTLPF